MKKVTSVLLVIALLCSIIPVFDVVSYSAAKDDYAYDCVAYAKARFREIWGFDLHPTGSAGANGYYFNASTYGDVVSSTPRAGALAVWDSTVNAWGHVAIVESVNGSSVTYSEGGYIPYVGASATFNQETRDMSNMSKTNQPFLGYVYVNGTSNLSKPTNAKLSINKTNFKIGENFTLYCESDTASSYYCSIYDADTNENVFGGNITQIYTTSFQKAGHYVGYMSAYNTLGTVDSNWIDFYVFGDAPTTAQIKSNKEFYELGETVVLKTYTDAYYVRIYISIFDSESDKVYEGNIPYTFEYLPTQKDKYSCYISAYTHEGGVDSKKIYFYVGEYAVTYNPNGGESAPANQTKKYGESITLSSSEPTRDGYVFLGWSTDSNATEPEYLPGDTYSENKDITLYAVWEKAVNEYTIKGALKTFGNSDDEILVDFYKPGESESCGYTIFRGDAEEFCIGGIQQGEYIIKISKPNHVTREYSVVVDKDIELDIQLNLIGDVDGNGKVNITDYNAILRHVKKTGALDGYAFDCADVDGNSRIMVTDYNAVLRHVKKIETLW